MPGLAGNQVGLDEVLEVRAGPLTEDEVWAILLKGSEMLLNILKSDNGLWDGFSITPDTLLLCFPGKIKFSHSSPTIVGKNSFIAPEAHSKKNLSSTRVDKIVVYSLGMTVFHGAEYETPDSKDLNISSTLENLLLSMCEESAQSRIGLESVIEVCRLNGQRRNHGDIINSLVMSVLGENIPELDDSFGEEPGSLSLRKRVSPDREILSSRSVNPSVDSDHRHSPPVVDPVTQAQPTSVQFVGSNQRQSSTPRLSSRPPSYNSLPSAPRNPHVLDKYEGYLKQVRQDSRNSSQHSSHNGSHLPKQLASHYNSSPELHTPSLQSGSSSRSNQPGSALDYEESKGYNEGPIRTRSRPDLLASSLGFPSNNMGRLASNGSVSETSSMGSEPRSLPSTNRSSVVSLTQGSYAPESYATEDYESDQYMRSYGSSVSQQNLHRIPEKSSDKPNPSSVTSSESEVDAGLPQRWNNSPTPPLSPKRKSNKDFKTPQKKLKTLLGPEFVLVTEDPNKSVVNITPKKGLSQIPPGRKLVTVVMLNGQKLQMVVEVHTKGEELFDQVAKYIGITEKVFFGLTIILDDDEHIFLDLDSKLSYYAPPGWKEKKNQKDVEPFTLFFRIRFFVEEIGLLKHKVTKHQYYLQLRRDLLEGHLFCHNDPAIVLGSFALQAEMGDWNTDFLSSKKLYFKPEHYVPQKVIEKNDMDAVCHQLIELHKKNIGMSTESAEMAFIEEAKTLQEYGVHFHKVRKNRKGDLIQLWIGICVKGIFVCESRGQSRATVQRHRWQQLEKLSFKKHRFLMKPQSSKKDSIYVPAKRWTFYVSRVKKARYLFTMCKASHRFQSKMSNRIEILQNQHDALQMPPSYDPIIDNNQKHDDRYPPENRHQDWRHESSDDDQSHHHDNHNYMQHPYMNQPYANGDVPRSSQTPSEDSQYGQFPDKQSMVDEHDVDAPYVLGTTLPPGVKFPKQTSLQDQTDGQAHVVRPEEMFSPDREIRTIRLRKDHGKGIGIRVIGGEDTKRLDQGIYVRSVSEGGPAHRDGRLNAGDRILAVNGISLEQVAHDFAVKTLKNTPENVELVVSQSRNPVPIPDTSEFASPSMNQNVERSVDEIAPHVRKEPERVQQRGRISSSSPSASPSSERMQQRVQNISPSPPASPRSELAFPSEDEPVTMVSKSLPANTPVTQYDKMQNNRLRPRKPQIQQEPRQNSDEVIEMDVDQISDRTLEMVRQTTIELPSDDDESIDPIIEQRIHSSNAPIDSNFAPQPLEPNIRMVDRSIYDDDDDDDDVDDVDDDYEEFRHRTTTSPALLNSAEIDEMNNLDDINGEEEDISDKTCEIELVKKGGGLGLSVTGGINTSVKMGGIYVKSLFPNGQADLDGRLRIGDRILAVNGISLVGVTHKQAIETLKRAPDHVVLKIDRSNPVTITNPRKSVTSQRNGPIQNMHKENPFCVDLIKGIGGLGLSLAGGVGSEPEHRELLRIKKMFPGQPAAVCGKLQIGDILLEANKKSLQGLTHAEAVNLLRKESEGITLLVKRDPSSIPPSLLRRHSSNVGKNPSRLLAELENNTPDDDEDDEVFRAEDSQHMNGYVTESFTGLPSLILPSHELDNQEQQHDKSINRTFSEPPNSNVPTDAKYTALRLSFSLPPMESEKQENSSEHPSLSQSDGEPSSPREISEMKSLTRLNAIDHCDSQSQNSISSLSDVSPMKSPNLDKDLEDDREAEVEQEDQSAHDTGQVEELEHVDEEVYTPAEELFEVVLHKGDKGLGFTLAGGANTSGGCLVRDIISDPAKSDGRLVKGDQILQVNEVDISRMSHNEAVNTLRLAKGWVTLLILRRPEKVLFSKTGHRLETVNLTRTSKGRVGLVLNELQNGEIIVEEVVEGEPAASQGKLNHGDTILEINGTRVTGLGQLKARQVLDAARPVVSLVIMRAEGTPVAKYAVDNHGQDYELDNAQNNREHVTSPQGLPEQYLSQSQRVSSPDIPNNGRIFSSDSPSNSLDLDSTPRVFSPDVVSEDFQDLSEVPEMIDSGFQKSKGTLYEVTLEKNIRGLGFSLVSNDPFGDDHGGINIKTIAPDSVAERDGRISIGDQLLKVNGESVDGLSHAKVIGMLRRASGAVTLELLRPSEEEDHKVYNGPYDVSQPLVEEQPPVEKRPSKMAMLQRSPHSIELDVDMHDDQDQSWHHPSKAAEILPKVDSSQDDDINDLINAIDNADDDGLSSCSQTDDEYDNDEDDEDDEQTLTDKRKRDSAQLLSAFLLSLSPPSDEPPQVITIDEDITMTEKENSSPYKDPMSWTISPPSSSPPTYEEPPPRKHDPANSESWMVPLDSPPTSPTQGRQDSKSPYYMRNENKVLPNLPSLTTSSTVPVPQPRGASPNLDVRPVPKPRTPPASLEDFPPPLPTTPIPSDDEEDSATIKPPPRTHSLVESRAMQNNDLTHPSPHRIVPRSQNSHVSDVPLLNVVQGGRYSGKRLKEIIKTIQNKINSEQPNTEFQALKDMKPTDNCASAKKPNNKDKNRYRNVIPFEKTRVQLHAGKSDYINANHIKVKVGPDMYHYIATQGPLPNTVEDFWRMVWEQQTNVIAMVTLDMEGGKIKCHRYWPDNARIPIRILDKFEVRLENKSTHDQYIERVIQLKNLETDQSMNVTHLNYTTWPDHGVPRCGTDLVVFAQHMRQLSKGKPIIVHCSAGIGRTGALIILDIIMGLIERDQTFEINKIIRNLREQRQGMIQTKDQYIFCYKASLEILQSLENS